MKNKIILYNKKIKMLYTLQVLDLPAAMTSFTFLQLVSASIQQSCPDLMVASIDVQKQKLTVECQSECHFTQVCEKLRYFDRPKMSFRMIREDFSFKKE